MIRSVSRYIRNHEHIPRPESHHEAPPSEEENSAIDIEGVENWDGSCFMVDGVDFRRLPERSNLKAHDAIVLPSRG